MSQLVTDPRKFPDAEHCSCKKCQSKCSRPCWPLPEEAQAIIDAGFGDRLMIDYWAKVTGKDTELLCPALVGYEGEFAPWWTRGMCTFYDTAGLCVLHDLGLKPVEARVAPHSQFEYHKNKDHQYNFNSLHEMVSKTWENKEARKIIKQWRKDRKEGKQPQE